MISRSKQTLFLAALAAAALLTLLAPGAAAQQVTFFNFTAPNTTNPVAASYSCSNTSPSANPPFCFNGTTNDPSFILDPANGTAYAAQLTSATGSQHASMWFSVPQVVAGGFNAWFAFKITPVSLSLSSSADGFAFVIQNAQGGKTDTLANCMESGNGLTVVGDSGGCIGYGGIDNSLALEFDTFWNSAWDPEQSTNNTTFDDNHISLQDCGAGNPNSPTHFVSTNSPGCEVFLPGPNNTSLPTLITNPAVSYAPPANPAAVTISDGNVHQVVVVYNGPNDTPANFIYVYLDPAFETGTLTPVSGSAPLFSGPYDIAQAMNLLASSTGTDSAYVGFTSATGFDYEQHEIMGWTFTPHTPVTQSQPLQPDGSPTYQPFPFGTHTYAVQYPANAEPTTGISMTVTANTVTPTLFSQLIAGTPYQGSACQVYDDTGGNCIIYSVSCSVTATGAPTACPAATVSDCNGDNAASCINVKTTYNSAQTPQTPGFIQGDPFFTAIASISGSGNTATITCTGECSVTPNQIVTVLGAQSSAFDGGYTVTGSTATNVFTATSNFSSSLTGSTTGGFLTSNNVQNIFVSWVPQNIDGTSTGRTTNFSDFVFTSITNNATTGIQLQAQNGSPVENQADPLTATVAGVSGTPPTGNVLFYAGATLLCTSPVSTVSNVTTATCVYTPTTTSPVSLTAVYSGDTMHIGITSAPLMLTATPNTVAVTVGTNLPGLSFTVDNVPYTTPQSLNWTPGSPHTIGTTSPQAGAAGTQYVFSGWSDAGAIAHPVTAPSTPASYTASFNTQYQLTTAANPAVGGTVSPASGTFFNAGTVVPLTATANPGYAFSSWTGSVVNSTVTMTAPQSVTANFTAVPVALVSPTSINFGTNIYLGSILTHSVTITNTGKAAITISDPLLSIVQGGDSSEFVAINLCPKSLAVGKSCIIEIVFLAGPFYTPQTATLKINDNAAGSPQTVMLTATVINPQAQFSPSSLSFGTAKTNSGSVTKSITLTSAGGTPLGITNIAIAGADPGDFTETNACSATMNPKAACSISVTFKPKSKGSRTGTLVVTDTAQNSPQSIPLSGTGN